MRLLLGELNLKNMFLIINKEKVYAYVVSVFTIVTLFVMSGMINSNFNNTEQTSSNIESSNQLNNVSNDNSELSNSFDINTNLYTYNK